MQFTDSGDNKTPANAKTNNDNDDPSHNFCLKSSVEMKVIKIYKSGCFFRNNTK